MVFSLGANYVLFPTVQVNALIGYSQQDAQAHRWTNAGYWTRVGTNVALPWGFTVGASAEFRWTNFEDGWGIFTPNGVAREDQTRILRATLLNRAITVYGFSPPDRVFQPSARIQRATLRLQTQPGRNALGPPVLAPPPLFCRRAI